jgi:dihydrofolate reductase
MISILVAMTDRGVIGRDGGLPWHLSADLKRFKQLTMGHAILMGRKTWESIGRALPGRRSLVITRQADYQAPGAEIAGSLDEALQKCGEVPDQSDIFIVGGAEIYRAALPRTDRLYVTRVEADVPGDTFFPELDWSQWRLLDETCHDPDEKNAHAYRFCIYERSPSIAGRQTSTRTGSA